MEIFELRYFLGVAKDENIHRASERLHVSPASLSKAVARLEGELGIKLFHREGRNIRLTPQGRLLQRRASEIVHLEESAKVEVGGHSGSLHAVLVGPEVLLSRFGLSIAAEIKKKYVSSSFECHVADDEAALEQIIRGESHIAVVTGEVPNTLQAKPLGQAMFQTYAGQGHPLFDTATDKRTVGIENILKHSFVSPSRAILGATGFKQSLDGWRDDKFPRRIEYLASSLKIIEELVVNGRALAYLPDYFAKKLNVAPLKITGCPYSCVQKIKMVVRDSKEIGWLQQIF